MSIMLNVFLLNRRSNNLLESSFAVQCLGQINSGYFEDYDYLYTRYIFCYGNDWEILGGIDNGLSQTAVMNHLAHNQKEIVWNFPIDVTFKSTNIFGWPRLAISVYGMDMFGRDVIRGYGSVLIPLQAGTHNLKVDMFKPVANSPLNQFFGWLSGNPPEVSRRHAFPNHHAFNIHCLICSPQFFDARFVSQSEGREVTRVQASGTVNVTVQVVLKGLEKFGYNV